MTIRRVLGVATPLCAAAAGCAGLQSVAPERAAERPVDSLAVDRLVVYAPHYEIRLEKSRFVEMRDGVRLSTDLYFPENLPEGASGELPVILIRTPYDKNVWRQGLELSLEADYPPRAVPFYWAAPFFAARGYVVAVQDLRGKYESEGSFFPYSAREGEDGHDTLSWLAAQPWSSGRIGTFGCSYLAEAQHMLAAERHPNHTASIAAAGSSSRGAGGVWNFGFTRYGAVELAAALSWNRRFGMPFAYGPPPEIDRQQWFASDGAAGYATAPVLPPPSAEAVLQALHTLPVIDAMQALSPVPTEFENWLAHSARPDSPYWHRQGMIGPEARFDVPTLHINSWYDITPNSTLALYGLYTANADSPRARDHQYLVMAASTHCAFESPEPGHRVGDRPVGDATLDFPAIYLAWFDHWLKDTHTGIIETLPRVMSYAMGLGQWRTADRWPLPGVREQRWYLHSGGRANSRGGDGRLLPEPPGTQPPDHYRYDPASPVPSVGGSICCVGPEVRSGGVDQREVEQRDDVLVYTSPPLEQGLEVVGPVELLLHVSSDAPSTDFVARLVDVHPDGTAYIVQEGIMRGHWRDGFASPSPFEPGGVYALRIDLEATHNFFRPGHRLRVSVSSSSFPRWDRNLNTGGSNYDEAAGVVADNAVHHSAAHPSWLRLYVREP